MKKLLSVLLVLLVVGGMAFGADDVLTVNSNVAPLFFHGFTTSQLASPGAIVTAANEVEAFNPTKEATVDFNDSTAQLLGYYSYVINTRVQFGISIEADPLTSANHVDTTNYYYVPYVLTFTDKNSNTIDFDFDLASAGTAQINPLQGTLVTAAYNNGIRWDSYQIDLTFGDYLENPEEGYVTLPADDYTADITITVTTV